ncbi:MAG: ferredoxin reductase family protein [Actinobacteria bacterium]|nr:ferredoxin reductase family protein [Actinomycetota bacterium]
MATTTGTGRSAPPAGARPARNDPPRRAPAGPPAPSTENRRDLAGTLALVTVAIVATLWAAHGGITDLTGGRAAQLTSLGRLAGLVSADLLLLQVLLMARIPWVERTFGQDALARQHRLVGFGSVTLMVAHVGLITAGYAATDRAGLAAEAWDLTAHYPGMLLAVAAFGLIGMVAVTSVRAARRRLRYESWHLLHLYAYLGVALALPHELWTGNDFTASPLARAWWWALYGVAAGSIVVFRLGVPLWRNARHRLRVAKVVHEAPGVVSVHLTGRDLDRLPVRAGQFFLFRFLDGAGWSRANPYSLSAAPRPDRLRITVKNLGDGSGRLGRLRPGTRVLVEGPFGRLTGDARRGRGATLVASGIGITPLRALLEEFAGGPGPVTLLYRASTADEFVFRDELDGIAAARGARIFYLPGPRLPDRSSWLPASAADIGDADALRHLVPELATQDVFVCGPGPWMDAVERAALAAGVPPERIHAERFAW